LAHPPNIGCFGRSQAILLQSMIAKVAEKGKFPDLVLGLGFIFTNRLSKVKNDPVKEPFLIKSSTS
jgi:hypothetical protein